MFKLINALAELVETSELWYDEISGVEYSDEEVTKETVDKWNIGMAADLQWQLDKVVAALRTLEQTLDKQTDSV